MTWAEEWEDLDPDRALALIQEGLKRLREEQVRNGVQAVDLSNPEARVTFAVRNLLGEHPRFEAVREYVFTRAAYRRLQTLDDLYLRMGAAAAGDVRKGDMEAFWNAQLVAWKTGQALAILDLVGELSVV